MPSKRQTRVPLTLACAALTLATAHAAPAKQMHEKLLYSFNNDAAGYYPYGVTWTKNHLVGTTYEGGSGVGGTVFSLTKAGTITVLHSFIVNTNDGADSTSGVIVDKLGNIYGTTIYGGPSNNGAVFKIDPTGAESFATDFTGCAGGANPLLGNLVASKGMIYGVTNTGQTCHSAGGSVYSITTSGAATVLFSFFGTDPATAGDNPQGVLLPLNGHLYGTAEYGGPAGVGGLFSISLKAGKPDEKLLYAFKGPNDGSYPTGGVILGTDGRFYGTTELGGAGGVGTLFAIDTSGNETTIHTFTGTGTDGSYPATALIADAAGNLYGTTEGGGTASDGTVFELSTTGQLTTLYSFGTGKNAATDGQTPSSPVSFDPAGNLYGTTQGGGANGYGAVYKLFK